MFFGSELGRGYRLVTWTGPLTGEFDEVFYNGALVENPSDGLPVGPGLRLLYDAQALFLVPEPSALLLLLLGAALGGGGRRTRA